MDKRILFAVARGARAQVQLGPNRGWINSTQLTWHDDCVYRIHPDQLEYQYGPISTALREVALTGDCDDADTPYIRITMLKEDGYSDSTEDQRCVFLLILAEALADEGL